MAPAAWLLLAAAASALVAPVRRATTKLQASTARDVLWTPNPDYVETTAMDRFQKAMQIFGLAVEYDCIVICGLELCEMPLLFLAFFVGIKLCKKYVFAVISFF